MSRFIDNNNQEGTGGEPIEYLGASIVHRIGAGADRRRGLQGREGRAPRAAARATQTPARKRGAKQTCGRASSRRARSEQLVDKPWMAVDVPRAGAQTCSIGGTGTGVPLQTFPGGRVYMAYALFDGPGEAARPHHVQLLSELRRDVERAAVMSRVQSADVNDDGVATTADVPASRRASARSCGQTDFNPNADINNDCTVNALDLELRGPRRRPSRPKPATAFAGRHARHPTSDGRSPGRLASIRRRRAARRHRHGAANNGGDGLFAPVVATSARSIRARAALRSAPTPTRRWP